MKTIVIEVSDETSTFMERQAYECEALKQVMVELISTGGDDERVLDSAVYKKFYERYMEAFAAYELSKQELIGVYVPESLRKSGLKYNWSLEYATRLLTITIDGDKIPEEVIKELEGNET